MHQEVGYSHSKSLNCDVEWWNSSAPQESAMNKHLELKAVVSNDQDVQSYVVSMLWVPFIHLVHHRLTYLNAAVGARLY